MSTQNQMTTAAENAGLVVTAAKMKQDILAMFDKNRPGFEEGIDTRHMTIPRAKLLQGLSQEVKDDPRTFYQGLIINSITKEVVSKVFIPLRKLKTRWVRFNAQDRKDPHFVPEFAEGAVIWQSEDPEDPRVKEQGAWVGNEPPLATEFINFLAYFEGFTIPLVVSFARSSFSAGKDFNTMAVSFGGAMYSRKYELSAVKKSKGSKEFYILQVRHAGKCSPDELEIGEVLNRNFGGVVKVHEEGADEAEA